MTSSATGLCESAHLLASRAIGWLARHRRRGALPPGTTAELTDPDNLYKPLGETALTAAVVLREGVASAEDARAARELLAFAWDQLGEGDLLYERQLQHTLITDPLEFYGHFARAGYRHERLDGLLAHWASLTSARHVELLPNRCLAVANAARLAGVDHNTDWEALTAATWLGNTPEPWALDWMTAYCVTHTVFHLTDWGANPRALPPRIRDYLATWLPVWLDVWREVRDWDLVAELMVVDSCLPEPRCTASDYQLLASTQREDGLMPRDGHEVDDDPEQAYHDHHHPTVVAAMAGTLALSRNLGAQ
ncbi:DUF6895 family protein [Pseudonocardia acaciae]|uniref:DUF6895 family protein n=1 Tax=Pseudonocardia acaciae TaxID=551276 RepID=UPI00048C7BA9|nr:hypothetical protein [Pseudonocardia acaciae]